MDGASLSRYPHLSWLGADFTFRADAGPTAIHLRSVACSISLTVTGRHSLRWICQGRERTWIEQPGTVHFRPCTWDWQDFVVHSAESGTVVAFFIPPKHLDEIIRSEHVGQAIEWDRLLLSSDPVLERSMLTLAACRGAPDDFVDKADEAGRRLVLRLVELSGGGRPDWHDDSGIFDRRTLGHVVEQIDAHLVVPPSLGEMGMRVGLSPSHFARKFRQSTGLSFHRFVNRRRVRASLEMLRDHSRQLAGVALELGFSSQSHFTRTFSDLTGMTPARYRRQCRRTTG